MYKLFTKPFRNIKSFRIFLSFLAKQKYNAHSIKTGQKLFNTLHPKYGCFKDFKKCVLKYNVDYEEYIHQFELWNKSEEERYEFMSQVSLRLLYNRLLTPDLEDIFWNKANFLRRYKAYIHRKWLDMRQASLDELNDFLKQYKAIAKPLTASCGHGVFIIPENISIEDLYQQLRGGGGEYII